MRRILERLLGVPLSAEDDARVLKNVLGGMSGAPAVAQLLSGVTHNTEKAGALLAAQGIFLVAAIFALDHGWPDALVTMAIFLLLGGALLLMSTLRSTARPFLTRTDETDRTHVMYSLLKSRMMRFNFALALTFLSVAILVIAALVSALSG